MRRILLVLAIAWLGCLPSSGVEWQALFIAGDDSIENFDNGRRDLAELLGGLGELNAIQLTSSPAVAREEGIGLADYAGVEAAFADFHASKGQGCLVHLTSHGSQDGLYLSQAGTLDPIYLAEQLERSCGKYPTVILVSACYSGVFLIDELKGPNRIILTAARPDRTSFGCSSDTRYTYWDGCLLGALEDGALWSEVHESVKTCVRRKERKIGADASEPQGFFGSKTENWTVLF